MRSRVHASIQSIPRHTRSIRTTHAHRQLQALPQDRQEGAAVGSQPRRGQGKMPAAFGSLLPFLKGGKGGRKRPSPGSTTTAAASDGSKKAKALTQTYLDLGQKSHGKCTLCGACGMLYVNGEAEDERDHAAFCRSVDAGLSFPGWKSERVVWGKKGKERVVEVRPTDGAAQLHKMGEVKRIVDHEMGFVPLAEGQKALGPQEKAFLYVRGKRVVGCLLAEKVEAAFPVITAEEEEEKDDPGEEKGQGDGSGCGGGEEQDGKGDGRPPKPQSSSSSSLLPKGVAYSLEARAAASLGVKQIWVGQACRRQGLAGRLVEVARARFYYGFVVPREQLAFSQLSTHGYAFARAYTAGTQRLLVY